LWTLPIIKAKEIVVPDVLEVALDQFEIIDVPVGVEEGKLNSGLVIYPNPFDNKINIKVIQNYSTIKVQLFEITGQLMEEQQFNNKSDFQIKNNYPKGVYFINVYGDGALITTQKVIKL